MYKIISISLFFVLCVYVCSCSPKASKSFITGKEVVTKEGTSKNWFPVPKFPINQKACGDFLDYAPDLQHIDHTPMRLVRINLHFVDSPEGGVNFTEEEGIEFAKCIVEISNKKLLKNAKMNLPADNDTPVLPAQYQYVLTGEEGKDSDNGIYFHKDERLFESNKKGGKYSLFSQEQYNKFGTRKGEVINIFFLEHHPDSIKSSTYKASGDGVGTPRWVKVVGACMVHHDNPKMSIRQIADNFSGVFNHEVGHSLGLRHTWRSNDGCEDTPESPNCWNVDKNAENCNEMGKVSNNMMDYNAWRSAITPCQIGRVHHKLSSPKSIQRKLLVPTWCDYKPEAAIRIATGEHIVWKSAKDLEGDVIIENGASLTLQCNLSLPQKAKISVAVGGKLVLDGATVTNLCGEQWQGIEVEREGKLKGIVEMLSYSKVVNVVHQVFY